MNSQTRKLRCIVVGMGNLSGTMLKVLSAKAWFHLAAVVDIREAARQEAKAAFNLPEGALFDDLEAALTGCDADVVIINTPSELHFAQCKSALEAGLHVLVAKPVTNDFSEAVRLTEISDATGARLAVGQQMRFNQHYETVRRFVQSGRLGTIEHIYFMNAKPRHKAGNVAPLAQPALHEMSCHHFDALMSLIPDTEPDSIVCDGFNPSWTVYSGPCMLNALIRFEPDIHVLYYAGFSSQAECYELRLEGTKGAFRCRGAHMSGKTFEYEFAPRGQGFEPAPIDDVAEVNPWETLIDQWHGHLVAGDDISFSGTNNLKAFALLSAGVASVERGGWIKIQGNAEYSAAFQPRTGQAA